MLLIDTVKKHRRMIQETDSLLCLHLFFSAKFVCNVFRQRIKVSSCDFNLQKLFASLPSKQKTHNKEGAFMIFVKLLMIVLDCKNLRILEKLPRVHRDNTVHPSRLPDKSA